MCIVNAPFVWLWLLETVQVPAAGRWQGDFGADVAKAGQLCSKLAAIAKSCLTFHPQIAELYVRMINTILRDNYG